MSWLDTLENIRTKDFSKATEKQRDQAARDVVNLCSYACAVVAVSPIPFSDAVLMLPVQSAMVITIGHIHGRKVTQADAKSLILELGATVGLGMLARQGIKALLPVVGALLTIPAAFAASWGIGRVAIEYFKNPGAVSSESLKEVFENAKKEGSQLFSRENFEKFRARGSVKAEPKKKAKAKKVAAAPVEEKKAPRTKIARLVEDDFAARLKKHPGVVKAIGARIHLDITGEGGGRWTVDCTRKADWVQPGLQGAPKLKVTTSTDSFLGLVNGTTNAQLAVLSGQLVLDPMDLEVAQELGKLFA
ncbi:MAG: hypothetical protein H6Q89_3760 [Myxococcaceae bacterium]|nr:hypothetical protein [Myxococcaceae bacterium]